MARCPARYVDELAAKIAAATTGRAARRCRCGSWHADGGGRRSRQRRFEQRLADRRSR